MSPWPLILGALLLAIGVITVLNAVIVVGIVIYVRRRARRERERQA